MTEEAKTSGVAAALAKIDGSTVALSEGGAVQPKTLDEALRFCKWAVESGLLPKGIDTASKAFVVIQKGAELGFTPMAAMEFIYPVNGRPRLAPAGALAKVKASGLLADYEEQVVGEGDSLRATVTSLRKGAPRAVVTVFTWADAKRAGLTGKDNWKAYPQRMVLARARGFNLQDNFPDLLGGLQIREAADLDPGERIGMESPRELAMIPAPAGPDPLLAEDAEVIPPKPPAPSGEVAPCCGKPHKPSEPCPLKGDG